MHGFGIYTLFSCMRVAGVSGKKEREMSNVSIGSHACI